jgi:long-chain fatty acid transport protein
MVRQTSNRQDRWEESMTYSLAAASRTVAASALGVAAVISTAHGSGFQIREQSGVAIANATAGASALAADVTYMNYNPASIGFITGTEIAVAGTAILPTFDVENASADPVFAPGTGLYGSNEDVSGDQSAFVPALAMKTDLSEDIALGLSITAPWGLATEYDEDWAGRFYAVETDLATININPVIAFRVNPKLTIAGGVQAQYADATLSNKVDYGLAGASAGVPGATPASGQEGLATVEGDDWAYGFNLGLLYQVTDTTRVGVAYRSKLDHEITGSAEFDADNASAAAVRNALRTAGFFTDPGGSADLNLPAVLSLGVSHQVGDRLTLLGEVSWTQWSEFEELVVEFEDNTPDSVNTYDWDDTFMFAVGANYRLNDRWILRGGVGYDDSPVTDDNRTPRIPDSDRTWLALGASFEPADNLTLSGSYVHIFMDDGEIDLRATPTNENASRGNLRADTSASVDLIALQATYRF